ncbi:hypothetical protein J4216_04940 [Candidatus Woesearchaeota archaeon]|nr:hypothetical protein [Candidatus Woesearchaeota archaeon]
MVYATPKETIRVAILNSDLTKALREEAVGIIEGRSFDVISASVKPYPFDEHDEIFKNLDALNIGKARLARFAVGLIAETLEQVGVPQLAAERLEYCFYGQLDGSFNDKLKTDSERVTAELTEENSRFGNKVLEDMMTAEIKPGQRLEIILRVGAEFDNGLSCDVPAIDPAGYQARYGMRSDLDQVPLLVYATGFRTDKYPRLNVSQGWNNSEDKPDYRCSRVAYVEPAAIAVCKKLIPEYLASEVSDTSNSTIHINLPTRKPWDNKVKARWQSAVNQLS